VKETEGRSNDKSEETKTATGLQYTKDHRCDRKGRFDGKGDLFRSRASNQGDPNKREEDQMTRSNWYSPQLSRELVSRLYVKAKAEGVPMTRLASRLIEQALSSSEKIMMPKANENSADSKSKQNSG
jgi:hypothetical protein